MLSGELLRTKRFAPFFWTMFAGAFNDNVFKNAVALIFAFRALEAKEADTLVNLAAGLFILPFFLLSSTAGQLADKFEKARVIRYVKVAEVFIMGLGAVGLILDSSALLLAVVFLMGAQSAFFGPVKFSILPQHLRDDELVAGNGLVEMGTFIAILLGTIVAGLLLTLGRSAGLALCAVVLIVAAFGYLLSRGIPNATPGAPALRVSYNIPKSTLAMLRHAAEHKSVMFSVLGISWFWFYGALFLAQLPGFTRDVLGGQELVVTTLLAAFSIGIGIGSLLCEKISAGKLELGLVTIGALGLTAFALEVYFASPSARLEGLTPAHFLMPWKHGFTYTRIFLDLMLIGVFGGLYIVPLYALVQQRTELEKRSRVIAATNILNALFMVLSAAFAIFMRQSGFEVISLFFITGILNFAFTTAIFLAIPEFFSGLLSLSRRGLERRGSSS